MECLLSTSFGNVVPYILKGSARCYGQTGVLWWRYSGSPRDSLALMFNWLYFGPCMSFLARIVRSREYLVEVQISMA